jgi:7,8-dihydroneopterin aldolase/epimerase/oxygenase
MIGKITLEGLEFHAFHGVYDFEKETGNNFLVDVTVETDFSKAAEADSLLGTVDYEVLYGLVKTEILKPSNLIETVAENIVNTILDSLPNVSNIELTVSKINPPIGGPCKRSAVTISKKR